MKKNFECVERLPANYHYAGHNLWLKSVIDRILAVIILIGTSPVLVLILAAMLGEGIFDQRARGPLLVSDRRLSQGRTFEMFKLRTFFLQQDAKDAAREGTHDIFNGTNVTRVGAWLRRFYIDEVAQLVNILIGDMSFVGPRPVPQSMYDRVLKSGYQNKRLLPAGLCGPVQALKGRWKEYGSYLDADEWLITAYETRSPLGVVVLDISIMRWTLLKVLEGDGLESPKR